MDKKKFGSTLLSFIIGLSAVPLCGVPVLADNSGTCGIDGDNLTWSLVDGTLTISGTGDMEDFGYGNAPWYNDSLNITQIIIEPGVTSIGQGAFAECNAVDVVIPEGVTNIGIDAFNYCSLETVIIPSSVTYIGDDAFYFCYCSDVFLLANPSLIWNDRYFDDFDEDNAPTCHVLSSKLSEYNNSSTISANINFVGDLDCGNNLIWTLNGNGVLTISGTEDMRNFGNFGSPWNSCRSNIKHVIIEDGVTSIGNNAFYYCEALTSVIIPNGVEEIGYKSFSNCTSLTSVTIPDSVISIGSYSFESCNSLAKVNISALSSQLTTIDDFAFSYCSSLTEFSLPSSLTTIGSGDGESFYGSTGIANVYCYADPAHLSWTDGSMDDFIKTPKQTTVCHVKSSDLSAFSTKFDDVNVRFVGDLDKGGSCGDNLSWTLDNNGVLTISGTGAMYNFDSNTSPWKNFCGDISSIVIENGATSIGEYAFYGCSSATQVTIPDSITSIGDQAFSSCSSLTSVKIPANVTSIGPDSFLGCSSCTSVYCYADPNELTWTENGNPNDFVASSPISCYVAGSKLTAFQTKFTDVNLTFEAMILAGGNCGAEGDNLTWTLDGDYNLIISGSGAMKAFNNPDSVPWSDYSGNIKSVVIENGATSIENYAFYGCAYLSSVTVPNSITRIGDSAFYSCRSLRSITLPSGVTSIGEEAFYACRIESIDIPSGVTTIEFNTFNNCSYLTSVTLPAGLTSIGSFAFSATSLTSITIPSSVTNISNEAFRYCESLADVYCYAKPSNLSWGDTADSNDFMTGEKVTKCHVPYNYKNGYETNFSAVNVTFTGDLDSVFDNGLCELTGHSLSLEGDIGVKFYMDLSADVVNNPDAKMAFAIPADGDTESYDVYVNPQADASKPHAETITVDGHTIYVFKCNVAAKEMTSTIVTKLVSGSAESEKYYYSVKEYADYILANPNIYQKEQELVKSMLVYGGYAQVYFDYNTDNLAYDGLAAADIAAVQNVTAATIEKYAYTGATDFSGITFTGVNLELKSELVMNLRFKNVPDGTVFKVGDQELAVRTSGSTTIVVYDKITAKNISSSVPVTIYNGTTVLGTVTYNPMTYCYNVLNRELSASRTQELKNVVAALYLYNNSASSYIPA